jgi:hypothetical protein
MQKLIPFLANLNIFKKNRSKINEINELKLLMDHIFCKHYVS